MQRNKSSALAGAIRVASLCATLVIPSAAHAVKGHCEGNTHWQCDIYPTSKEDGAWYDSKTGQWYNKHCFCQENGSGSGTGGNYGHAEIHKKNVPTVKPSGAGPANLARPPVGMAPRTPARGAPPAAFQPGRAF